MKVIEVTEKEVKAAFEVAKGEETKAVLAALFCKPEHTPSLDDYKSIKSYEDALAALGEEAPDFGTLPKHIVALMKLETVSRALWGRTFQPLPDAEGGKIYWFPWFALWTKDEIENRKDEFEGALLSANATNGAYAGFGYLGTFYRSSYSNADIGFRLCQETQEKAAYLGKTFIKLWADYLTFNFTVGDYYFPNNN